ncbi:alpha/beta hydrolase fold domain-containing protein [Nakamurella sp.]|uniref:alpha/beta hydrolase fold domain-containing protein n=1 Tax=Nakamurella sp. TaxID=1869182 RepID=UPI003B3BE8BF
MTPPASAGTPTLPLPGPRVEWAALPPARTTADGVRVLAGVPYAGLPGARPLELDLWLPAAPGTAATAVPAVVFLHGGGWRLGSRHSVGPAYAGESPSPLERLARSGIAVASVDYRLSGEAVFPAQLHDAKAAVRWLRARAPELGIDPDRIAAWGESAGGHLAELLGLTAGHPVLEGAVGVDGSAGELSSSVAAVVAWYAPSDVAAVAADAGADPLDATTREAQLLGAPAAAVPDRAALASPIGHVHPSAPPMLLLHGRADRFVSCRQSERLHAALVAAGVGAQLHLYDDADHMWLGATDAAADAVTRTMTFLHHHLRGEHP